MYLPGQRPALANAAQALLKDYRAGRLGKHTLELPPAEDRNTKPDGAQEVKP